MNQKAEFIKALVLLPGSAVVVIPAVILYFWPPHLPFFGIPFPFAGWILVLFLLLLFTGLWGAASTVSLFMTVGEGTPAPWSPPRKFVVEGFYRYVRNPMLLSVFALLIAEALYFGSVPLFFWCALFWILNHFYLLHFEEPGLKNRFGKDYLEYLNHVSRWLPRLTPWYENRPPNADPTQEGKRESP